MNTDTIKLKLADWRQTLAESAVAETESRLVETKIHRFECEVDAVDPLAWLATQPGSHKVYWRSRAGEFEMAGVGVADTHFHETGVNTVRTMQQLHDRLAVSDPGTRYFGGMAFSDLSPAFDESWREIGRLRFFVPRFELLRHGDDGACRFACNFLGESTDSDRRMHELDGMPAVCVDAPALFDNTPIRCSRCEDVPGWSRWNENVLGVLDRIRSGSIDKLVLARKSIFELDGRTDPLYVLNRIRENVVNCFLFGLFIDNGHAFIAASPERLYRRQSDIVVAEAIAGTCMRGSTEDADTHLGLDLMRSEKNRREHQYVVTDVSERLEKLGGLLSADKNDVSLMKLNQVQHLFLELTAEVPETVITGEILKHLHPTSAVAGYPGERALSILSEYEPFDRGWYASPVGWIGRDESEFVVAIRSALLKGKRMEVYTGAGIVDGSTPKLEWQELEHKLQSFLSLITGMAR